MFSRRYRSFLAPVKGSLAGNAGALSTSTWIGAALFIFSQTGAMVVLEDGETVNGPTGLGVSDLSMGSDSVSSLISLTIIVDAILSFRWTWRVVVQAAE